MRKFEASPLPVPRRHVSRSKAKTVHGRPIAVCLLASAFRKRWLVDASSDRHRLRPRCTDNKCLGIALDQRGWVLRCAGGQPRDSMHARQWYLERDSVMNEVKV